jgi:hypothetical protein
MRALLIHAVETRKPNQSIKEAVAHFLRAYGVGKRLVADPALHENIEQLLADRALHENKCYRVDPSHCASREAISRAALNEAISRAGLNKAISPAALNKAVWAYYRHRPGRKS